jgi:putative FmdB family regulatory protein
VIIIPIYEYECNACLEGFEKLVMSAIEEPDRCSICQSKDIRKVISKSSFRMNGIKQEIKQEVSET